ncbi:hypothetical protein [Paenibacillus sp. J45TS6]|nr:hypothetical protein [Paenibacillus sp. J45TS6]
MFLPAARAKLSSVPAEGVFSAWKLRRRICKASTQDKQRLLPQT